MDRRERGRIGERAAEKLLRRAGMVILARNWRAAGGEIDLAALDGRTLVFVEVKSRSRGFVPGLPEVSRGQRRRTARAAQAFRTRYSVRELPFRFDLVTVSGDAIAWQKDYHGT
jgi:putative endonuclease